MTTKCYKRARKGIRQHIIKSTNEEWQGCGRQFKFAKQFQKIIEVQHQREAGASWKYSNESVTEGLLSAQRAIFLHFFQYTPKSSLCVNQSQRVTLSHASHFRHRPGAPVCAASRMSPEAFFHRPDSSRAENRTERSTQSEHIPIQ